MEEQGIYRPADDNEINLLDYWRVVWKYKWLIGALFVSSVTAALVVSLSSPNIYESETTILTPKEVSGSGLLGALGIAGLGQQIGGISLPSLTPNRDIIISLLKSRTLAKNLVGELKLQDYYKAGRVDDAIGSLQGATKVSVSKEGIIEIRVEDVDPKMAANIANAYVGQLDRMIMQLGTGSAGNQRKFVSEQLAKAEGELRSAEDSLREFQERNRAVLLGDMANSMRLPATRVPQVGLDLARLTRNLKAQEAIYISLTQQLEQAKISEAQDMPVVQALDPAIPRPRPVKPKIKLNVTLAGAVSLFLGVFLAFFVEYIQRQRSLMSNVQSPMSESNP
jgi:uncharacterized protein involved in exopolysaccharide biosynthesis